MVGPEGPYKGFKISMLNDQVSHKFSLCVPIVWLTTPFRYAHRQSANWPRIEER